MNTPVPTNRYKNHHFPAEIISHAVWLYFRFCLSYRDVEELLFARGVMLCPLIVYTDLNSLRLLAEWHEVSRN